LYTVLLDIGTPLVFVAAEENGKLSDVYDGYDVILEGNPICILILLPSPLL
jgi:hypothetical protein